MACAWGELPRPPPPTKLVDELPERRHPPKNTKFMASDDFIEDILRRLDTCVSDIGDLRGKQEEIFLQSDSFRKKLEDLDWVHRNQIDCISKRVFEAEKQLSEAQQMQDDAIAKANAVFDKHAGEVEQERQNLMSVIGQVNRNFDHLSSEIAQNTNVMQGYDQRMATLEQAIDDLAQDFNVDEAVEKAMSESTDHQRIDVLEQALQNQQSIISEVQCDLQETRQVVDQVAPQCAECKSRLRVLAGQLTEMQAAISGMENSVSVVLRNMNELQQDHRVYDDSQVCLQAPPRRGVQMSVRPSYPEDSVLEPESMSQPAFRNSGLIGAFGAPLPSQRELNDDEVYVEPGRSPENGGFPFASPQRGGLHFSAPVFSRQHEHQQAAGHGSFGNISWDQTACQDPELTGSGGAEHLHHRLRLAEQQRRRTDVPGMEEAQERLPDDSLASVSAAAEAVRSQFARSAQDLAAVEDDGDWESDGPGVPVDVDPQEMWNFVRAYTEGSVRNVEQRAQLLKWISDRRIPAAGPDASTVPSVALGPQHAIHFGAQVQL